jgi:hypothetical protein
LSSGTAYGDDLPRRSITVKIEQAIATDFVLLRLSFRALVPLKTVSHMGTGRHSQARKIRSRLGYVPALCLLRDNCNLWTTATFHIMCIGLIDYSMAFLKTSRCIYITTLFIYVLLFFWLMRCSLSSYSYERNKCFNCFCLLYFFFLLHCLASFFQSDF